MKINILGTDYIIEKRLRLEDTSLETLDGYHDGSKKLIVIINNDDNSSCKSFNYYQRVILRHEIIHAFLYESGLDGSWEHPYRFGHDETTIDWFAIQFPKIQKAFKEIGCLD